MSCEPELVTGLVDEALDAEQAARVSRHLETCAACREQLAAEQSLRARLRALQPPEPPFGLEKRIRGRLRQPTSGTQGRPALRRWTRVLLPLAASLAVLVLWMRGSPEALAFALAFDHAKCFRKADPPAKVWAADPEQVATWFERQGTHLPEVPSQAGTLALRGARYCPLLDASSAAHLYYQDGPRHLSVFLIPRPLATSSGLSLTSRGRAVRLLDRTDATIGIVAETDADADAMAALLQVRTARAESSPLS